VHFEPSLKLERIVLGDAPLASRVVLHGRRSGRVLPRREGSQGLVGKYDLRAEKDIVSVSGVREYVVSRGAQESPAWRTTAYIPCRQMAWSQYLLRLGVSLRILIERFPMYVERFLRLRSCLYAMNQLGICETGSRHAIIP